MFKDNSICFENLENLLTSNNSIFIEVYGTCYVENNNIDITLNMISEDENITCISNAIIGNNNSFKNNYLTFGPISYKLTKNLNESKCIYYKNKFDFKLMSDYQCNVKDIKIIIKLLNYNL